MEADSIATRVQELPAGARAMVLYGAAQDVSEILKNAMDRRLRFLGSVPLAGPYYTEVLLYAA